MTRRPPSGLGPTLGLAAVLAATVSPLEAQRRAPEMIPEEEPSLVGRTAPEIEGPLLAPLDGRSSLRLSELRGRPVVVAFWASWCTPCRHELPALSRFARAHPEVQVIAVNVDRERDRAEAFLRGVPVHLPIVFDPRAISLGRYGVVSMPTMFLVDRNGTVKLTRVGFSRERGLEELERALETLR